MVEIELTIIIRLAGGSFMDPGKAKLLRMVRETGSLNAAARVLTLSYQHAWNMVDTMNKLAPKPVVEKKRGGSGGGGAVLTKYGTLILDEYDSISRQVSRFTKQLNQEINL
jgi:molybdate transport system regulatory protein